MTWGSPVFTTQSLQDFHLRFQVPSFSSAKVWEQQLQWATAATSLTVERAALVVRMWSGEQHELLALPCRTCIHSQTRAKTRIQEVFAKWTESHGARCVSSAARFSKHAPIFLNMGSLNSSEALTGTLLTKIHLLSHLQRCILVSPLTARTQLLPSTSSWGAYLWVSTAAYAASQYGLRVEKRSSGCPEAQQCRSRDFPIAAAQLQQCSFFKGLLSRMSATQPRALDDVYQWEMFKYRRESLSWTHGGMGWGWRACLA